MFLAAKLLKVSKRIVILDIAVDGPYWDVNSVCIGVHKLMAKRTVQTINIIVKGKMQIKTVDGWCCG